MEEGIRFRKSFLITLLFIIVMWSIKGVEYTLGYNFGEYGILPRTLSGSVGIFTAPLIHGDFFHLISNTLPILILGVGLFYFYDKIAPWVVLIIYFITGFWVWIAAREAYHIGASGIVYGLLTFLLVSGFIRKNTSSLAISFIVLFIYGGTLFTGVIPADSSISWESHLLGALSGVFCAIYFKNFDREVEPNVASDETGAGNQSFQYYYKPSAEEQENESPKGQSYTIRYTFKSKDN